MIKQTFWFEKEIMCYVFVNFKQIPRDLHNLIVWSMTPQKFHGHWPSDREVTQEGGICPPPALPDSEKPGLFGVKSEKFLTASKKC